MRKKIEKKIREGERQEKEAKMTFGLVLSIMNCYYIEWNVVGCLDGGWSFVRVFHRDAAATADAS